MDVGPDGFITPKRPDRGNEAGVLGILAGYESSRGRLNDLCIGRKREGHRHDDRPGPDLVRF
jgi:hypothetical protein